MALPMSQEEFMSSLSAEQEVMFYYFVGLALKEGAEQERENSIKLLKRAPLRIEI